MDDSQWSNLGMGMSRFVAVIVYVSFLLDNILFTMVVPIVPHYLLKGSEETLPPPDVTSPFDVTSENGRIGLLLSTKAIVQLILNPVVGLVATKVGNAIPLVFGHVCLVASAATFAFGEDYLHLVVARCVHGIASACIGITGMSLVAEHFPTEPGRSRTMGFILGSIAAGVLIGYPLGGFIYDTLGKTVAFVSVAVPACVILGIGYRFLDMSPRLEDYNGYGDWFRLFSDNTIFLTGAAIWLSTSAMAILEPCLPVWLMKEIKPAEWQLGTVFIPDSVGYFIGTNLTGMNIIGRHRVRVAMTALVAVGLSCILIPTATSMTRLVIPHFFLGLGIGVVDAALVPLLAALVDARRSTQYVTVYAAQQMAVSLAYSVGPVFGGEMVRVIGFPWVMRLVGFINILYAPVLYIVDRYCEKSDVHEVVSTDLHGYEAFPEEVELQE